MGKVQPQVSVGRGGLKGWDGEVLIYTEKSLVMFGSNDTKVLLTVD